MGMNEEKTILFVAAFPPPIHGASKMNQLICSLLSHHFRFICIDTSDKRGIEYVGRPGKPVIDLRKIVLLISQLIRFLRATKRKPSLVYITNCGTATGSLRDILFLLLSYIAGIKVVVENRAGGYDDYFRSWPKMLQWGLKYIYEKVEMGIALGEKQRKCFSVLLPNDKIVVIENALPYHEPARREYEKEKIIALFMSHFRREKGYHLFLRSIRYVIEKNKDVEFHVVGTGVSKEEDNEAQEIIRMDDISNHVKYLGYVTEDEAKWRIFSEADIFVFPTIIAESFSVVTLEAMRASLPVITTDKVPIVKPDVTAIVIPSPTPEKIAEMIVQLCKDPNERKRLGENGRKAYDEKYTTERLEKEFIALFTSVISSENKD